MCYVHKWYLKENLVLSLCIRLTNIWTLLNVGSSASTGWLCAWVYHVAILHGHRWQYQIPNPIGQHDYVHLLKITPISLNKSVVAQGEVMYNRLKFFTVIFTTSLGKGSVRASLIICLQLIINHCQSVPPTRLLCIQPSSVLPGNKENNVTLLLSWHLTRLSYPSNTLWAKGSFSSALTRRRSRLGDGNTKSFPLHYKWL